jgi:hypothetical protein
MDRTRGLFALGAILALGLFFPSRVDAQTAPDAAIACVSEGRLWSFLDARDGNDAAAMRQLLKGECRTLGSATYSLVTSRNGTAQILVFKKPGDWESAETMYTLDEMLGPDHNGSLDTPLSLS